MLIFNFHDIENKCFTDYPKIQLEYYKISIKICIFFLANNNMMYIKKNSKLYEIVFDMRLKLLDQ